ncbi:hypothetical protein [Brevundimonas sp.]|uniref:hypothetical protein n=1 Tax=Brevundimonas sp. TaxID=1871086 RepID=UPI002D3EDF18|nr:hypothetical protein [Brevundimonas sp.]HYD26954.1 hypothetical protein [Brevundimonas sp.]
MDAVVAACWGFAGAVPYAGTRLATALWGSSDVDARQRKLAAAHFAIAMFTGPVTAAALAPWVAAWLHMARLEAVAVALGLFSNAAWPVVTDRAVVGRLLTWFGGQLLKLGADASGDANPKGNS